MTYCQSKLPNDDNTPRQTQNGHTLQICDQTQVLWLPCFTTIIDLVPDLFIIYALAQSIESVAAETHQA